MRRVLWWSIGVILGVAVAAGPMAVSATAAAAPPYVDANAQGSVGLCDQAGHQITSGRISAKPFVWAAVSSVGPPRGYGGDGRTAALFVYQPRRDVPAGEWSGQLMTSSSRYTNAAHPMTVATGGDSSLADYLSTFPASWDGYLELRLYVGAPGQPQYTQSYPATDIQVSGDTWRVVRGGTGPCGVGTAQSLESRVLPANLTDPDTSVTTAPSSPTSTLTINPTTIVGKKSGGESAQATRASAQPAKTTSGGGPAVVLIVAVALVAALVVGGGVLLARRRSPRPIETPTSEDPR